MRCSTPPDLARSSASQQLRAFYPMISVLGLSRNAVLLVPHQPAWSRLFAREAARLRSLLGPRLLSVEHVGSTAVPALDAKPILDLAAAVPSLAEAGPLIPLLGTLGYEHKPDPEIPERLYFVLGPPERRTHHLSLAEPDSRFWRDHLLFRDLLREQPELARAYARLKHQLAEANPNDRRAYTRGKQAFIEAALARGRTTP